jgi:hypothetical protein
LLVRSPDVPGARQAEPSLVGSGCCWRHGVTSGIAIGSDYIEREAFGVCHVGRHRAENVVSQHSGDCYPPQRAELASRRRLHQFHRHGSRLPIGKGTGLCLAAVGYQSCEYWLTGNTRGLLRRPPTHAGGDRELDAVGRVGSNGGRMTPTRRVLPERATVRRAAFLLAILALVAACATPAGGPGGSGIILTGSSQEPEPQDRLHRQAHDALQRWADAVRKSGGASIAFVGDLTGQIGDWEAAVGDNNKAALFAGLVEAPHGLSASPPASDKVRWLDGSTVDVRVLSATDALAALVAAATSTCDECTPLEITDAQQATGIVDTSRGAANAPIWVYSLAGTTVKVTRVAVDASVTVDPPPWNADDPPEGLRIERATGTADSKKLTVSFVGAPNAADKPCGEDYTTEAVESELAVVVIVYRHPNPTPGACDALGAMRSAKVTLRAPLGNRVVLEVQQGLPVAVTAP